MNVNNINKQIPAIVSSVFLIIALAGEYFDVEYGFFQLLRVIIFCSSCFYIFIAFKKKEWFTFWPFIFLAILFNFLSPIHFNKDTWQTLDVLSLLFFIAFLLYINIFIIKKFYKVILYVLALLLFIMILFAAAAFIIASFNNY